MSEQESAGRHLVGGSLRVVAAEALGPATSLITAAYLARRLGPDGCGLISLTVAVVYLLQSISVRLLGRASIKFVRDADDWMSVATAVHRVQVGLGLAAMLLIWAIADPIAGWLDEPRLAHYLRLFAIDIPIFNSGLVHRNVLIGRGRYSSSAMGNAARWLGRLALILALVELLGRWGWGVEGALLGTVGASVTELVVLRTRLRLPILARTSFRVRTMADYAVALFVFGLAVSLFKRMDLFLLKALGGSTDEAGIYGAAQNLTRLADVLAISVAPLLLSTMSQLIKEGDDGEARRLARQALRVTILIFPFAAIVAATAGEVMRFVYGVEFVSGEWPLAVLTLALGGQLGVTMVVAILVAIGHPGRCISIGLMLVGGGVIGNLLLIPMWGAVGAAAARSGVAVVTFIVSLALLKGVWSIELPLSSAARSLLIAAVAFAALFWVPAVGFWLPLKLAVAAGLAVLALIAVREFDHQELAFIRWSLLRPGRIDAGGGGL